MCILDPRIASAQDPTADWSTADTLRGCRVRRTHLSAKVHKTPPTHDTAHGRRRMHPVQVQSRGQPHAGKFNALFPSGTQISLGHRKHAPARHVHNFHGYTCGPRQINYDPGGVLKGIGVVAPENTPRCGRLSCRQIHLHRWPCTCRAQESR